MSEKKEADLEAQRAEHHYAHRDEDDADGQSESRRRRMLHERERHRLAAGEPERPEVGELPGSALRVEDDDGDEDEG